jgi:hypothetical protein
MVQSLADARNKKALAQLGRIFFAITAAIIIGGVWWWAIAGMSGAVIFAWLFTWVFTGIIAMGTFGMSLQE